MAIMCLFSTLNVSPGAYDAVRKAIDWEGRVPPGAVAHFIGFRNGSAAEVDVWETRADYENYRDTRLKPALAELGITIDEPEILDLHIGALGGETVALYVVPRALTSA
jgi:hypothetical protein